jgi:hypothetical protein
MSLANVGEIKVQSNHSKYFELLLRYKLLPRSKRCPSIFEVSGYPHYENVCSNVLAFYLHPKKEHGLGNLVLAALLKCFDPILEKPIGNIRVEREFSTSSSGRIDIMIVSDEYVIGIENKIFHTLNNDLPDYLATINGLCEGKLKPVPIVLSLKPIELPKETGFINITYDKLWWEVKANLGFYATVDSGKWISYLIDFMETTKSLAGGSMDLNETDQFFINNQLLIDELINDRNIFLTKLNFQIPKLKERIEGSGKLPIKIEKQWIFRGDYLVHDYILSGNQKIAFDLYISPKGWTLELFGRNESSNSYLKELLATRTDKFHFTENRRFLIKKWDSLSTDLDEIAELTCEWMNWLVQADVKNQH